MRLPQAELLEQLSLQSLLASAKIRYDKIGGARKFFSRTRLRFGYAEALAKAAGQRKAQLVALTSRKQNPQIVSPQLTGC